MNDDDIDYLSTAEAIVQNAETLEHYATELRRNAEQLLKRKDFHYASEALQTLQNCFGNVRLDLVLTRPLRALRYKNS